MRWPKWTKHFRDILNCDEAFSHAQKTVFFSSFFSLNLLSDVRSSICHRFVLPAFEKNDWIARETKAIQTWISFWPNSVIWFNRFFSHWNYREFLWQFGKPKMELKQSICTSICVRVHRTSIQKSKSLFVLSPKLLPLKRYGCPCHSCDVSFVLSRCFQYHPMFFLLKCKAICVCVCVRARSLRVISICQLHCILGI